MEFIANVALNGSHYAKVNFGAMTEDQAKERFKDVSKRFPASEGFSLVLTKWETVGYRIAYSEGA